MTPDQIRELAKAAGWQPENQALWLSRKGFDSWEAADEDTREFACEMIRDSVKMFGKDVVEGLKVYEGDV